MMSGDLPEERRKEITHRARVLGIPVSRLLTYLAVGGAAGLLGAVAAGRGRIRGNQVAPPGKTPAPGVYKPVPGQFFTRHDDINYETRLETMAGRGYFFPNSLFYIRNHVPTPFIDVNSWQLSVDGDGIEKPLSLSYEDLLKLPAKTETRFLECAGNGRAFYKEVMGRPAKGNQWRLGAYGIAEWTGVPLGEVLERAGIKKTAVDVLVRGMDSKAVDRPVPVAKAMDPDTLLAYAMNGEILPRDHGFPLRLIAPGWAGISNIKWVGGITVSERRVYTEWNTTDYVLAGPDYPPDPPAEGEVITTVPVKSACLLPWPGVLKAGRQTISGYAWSPFGKIDRVEVSLDGGGTFENAALTGPNIAGAGTRWEFGFTASPGEMTITPRAVDDKGNAEYDISKQKWNRDGYLFGAAAPHPVKVV